MININYSARPADVKENEVATDNFSTHGNKLPYANALFEGTNNALEATGTMPYTGRKVYIRTFKTKKYPWLQKGKRYLELINGNLHEEYGHSVESLFKMMDNGYSAQNGPNHQYGVGHLIFLSKLTPIRQNYYTFTKRDDCYEWISGPYVKRPKHGKCSLSFWNKFFPEWAKTVTIVEVEDETFNLSDYYDDFCKKYNFALLEDEELEIKVEKKRLVPANDFKGFVPISKEENVYNPEFDAYFDFYEYVATGRIGTSETAGVFINSYGVTITGNDVSCIAKINHRDDDADKWQNGHGYSSKIHPSFIPLTTVVNIRQKSNKVCIPFTADKSSIDWTDSVGKKLRKYIDNIIGNRFRTAHKLYEEKESRKYLDFCFGRIFGYDVSEKLIYLTEVKCGGAEIYGTLKKADTIDAMLLPITDKNRAKVEAFLESNSKQYVLSEEDFADYDFEVFLFEFKKTTSLTRDNVDQVLKYGRQIKMNFFPDRYKKSELKKHIHCVLVGDSFDESAKKRKTKSTVISDKYLARYMKDAASDAGFSLVDVPYFTNM